MRKILVTAALPYANGPIHLGHLLEYIQTDIWVRFQKLMGNDCLYLCGNDAHGTPIMISAQQQGITPEELVTKTHAEHSRDLADFYVDFDNFYTTHSPENQELVEMIYSRLVANNDIEKRVISQTYDPKKEMFLPDRFVKGECPRCHTKDQYGDNCEVCGAAYSPTELINPISVLSGTTPIQKDSEHYFFRLEKYSDMLHNWINSGHIQPEVANKLNEWFGIGLKSWDISRDAPYFGFNIPENKDKYFYVWLDAPIGYIASFNNLAKNHPELDFNSYWLDDKQTELYHFIGKDIVYFHALFWPAILTSAKLRKPNAIFVHGYLTINGQKLSKSRGIFISASNYLKQLNPEYLRYYYAAKLNNRIDDIDLNLEDFRARVNSDLIGKVVNIASRCAGFINKSSQPMSTQLSEPTLFNEFIERGKFIAELYEKLEYSHAVREIMALADKANQYIDEKKPWVLAKQGQSQEVINVCSMGLNLFRLLIVYLKPILPKTAENSEQFLNIPPLTWANRAQPLLNHAINQFVPLMQRIEQEKIEALVN